MEKSEDVGLPYPSLFQNRSTIVLSTPIVSAPSRPTSVQYLRRRQIDDTIPLSSDVTLLNPLENLDLPIALQKGTRQCESTYSISNFISYDQLSATSSCMIACQDSISISKTVKDALNHLGWHDAMLKEKHTLDDYHTWDLVDLPKGKKAVGFKWIFVVKVNPDGSVAILNA